MSSEQVERWQWLRSGLPEYEPTNADEERGYALELLDALEAQREEKDRWREALNEIATTPDEGWVAPLDTIARLAGIAQDALEQESRGGV